MDDKLPTVRGGSRRSSATASPTAATQADLLARVRRYAATVAIDVNLSNVSWEISTRAKRRAGACLYDRATEAVTIRLAWDAYRVYDWAQFAAVVRHELIHAWEYQRFGESSHGRRFERKARTLDVSIRCPRFARARLKLRCTNDECSWTARRHRASVVVTHPERRRCGRCGTAYLVEHFATGRTWRTSNGYNRAREAIGDDW